MTSLVNCYICGESSQWLTDLRQQIRKDVQPWEKVADLIRWDATTLAYSFLKDSPPQNIDIFDNEKTRKDPNVLYYSVEKGSVVSTIEGFSEHLELQTARIQRAMSEYADCLRTAKLLVTPLKQKEPIETFSYKVYSS